MSTSTSKKRGASSPGGSERSQKSRQRSTSPTSDDKSPAAAEVDVVAPSVDQAGFDAPESPSKPESDVCDASYESESDGPLCRGWDEFAKELVHSNMFKKTYRMEKESFDDLVDLIRPALMRHEHYYCRTVSTGTPAKRGRPVPAEIRLAVGLRMVYGSSHFDVCTVWGVPLNAAEPMVKQVVDAINSCEEVGKNFLPRVKKQCKRYDERFEAPTLQDVMEQMEMESSRG